MTEGDVVVAIQIAPADISGEDADGAWGRVTEVHQPRWAITLPG